MKLYELVQQIGGVLDGDGRIEISGVAGIREAEAREISFVANPKYAMEAANTRAGAVIVSEDWADKCSAALIRTPNPDAAFAKAAMLFYTPAPLPAEGIHPSAVVAEDIKMGEGVRVGPLCVIESGVMIGAGTTISAQCYIGHGVRIGENSRLYPQVSIRECSLIGNRTTIHNGTVAEIGGGKFANGAATGAMIYQFNHLAHRNKVDRITVDDAAVTPGDSKYIIEQDGIITDGEAIYHYKHGKGVSLTADASKMKLIKFTKGLFSGRTVVTGVNDYKVHGQVSLINGKIRSGPYDYGMHRWDSVINVVRNIGTRIRSQMIGPGTDYWIKYENTPQVITY